MRKALYLIGLLFLLASCDPLRVFDDNVDIENNNWKKEDTLSFEFDIQNTEIPYDLFYTIRYNSDYPFYNLFTKYYLYDAQGKLLVTPKLPEDMYLFDMKTGTPFGKGLGNIYEQRINFKKSFKFSAKGNYKIKVVQYMRNEPLPGIVSFGVRVAKSEESK